MNKNIALFLAIIILSFAFIGCEFIEFTKNDNDSEEKYSKGLDDNDSEEKYSKGLEFYLIDDSEYQVIGIGTCKDKDIVIPHTYKGKPVTWIPTGAFMNCTQIESIVIPKSVTRIDNLSFEGCTSLERVVFENTSHWGFGIWEYNEYWDMYEFVLVPIEEDISDPSVAAKLLTSTYVNNILKIIEE